MKLALASVSDKTGLVEFAKSLEKSGFCFLASGGTAKALQAAGIKVKEVSEYTSSPEILGGRVKTLHPFIHGGLLARNTQADMDELKNLNIEKIDMLISNLYPFEKTIANINSCDEECIENIDIGGVALLRAAAKNFERTAVVCDQSDYEKVARSLDEKGELPLNLRRALAIKAFAVCTKYDAEITNWLQSKQNELAVKNEIDDKNEIYGKTEDTASTENNIEIIAGYNKKELRYGENPHQKAWLYSNSQNGQDALGGKLLQGKELSYNNILDADAAWRAVSVFENPAAVVVKHLTPCGLAELGEAQKESELFLALGAAIACDPVSAFGSIIAVNRPFDIGCTDSIKELFVECIVAPKFTDEAKTALSKKKNLRLIEAPLACSEERFEFKSVLGGFLKQEKDSGNFEADNSSCKNSGENSSIINELTNPTKRKAGEAELPLLKFAMKACSMVKSNAILLAAPIDGENSAKGFCSVGIGCGQPNRVDAAKQAIIRAGEKAKNSVLASDAFFPFPDTIKAAADAGIKAVIQPGGSIRDDLSIAECDKHNMTMLMTGVRHFKH